MPFLSAIGGYFHRVLLGLDQSVNTIFGGYPDETISARVGRRREIDRLAAAIAAFLDEIEPGHTQRAIDHEFDESQNDPYYRVGYLPGRRLDPEPPPEQGEKPS